jgi:hypothetical protein
VRVKEIRLEKRSTRESEGAQREEVLVRVKDIRLERRSIGESEGDQVREKEYR